MECFARRCQQRFMRWNSLDLSTVILDQKIRVCRIPVQIPFFENFRSNGYADFFVGFFIFKRICLSFGHFDRVCVVCVPGNERCCQLNTFEYWKYMNIFACIISNNGSVSRPRGSKFSIDTYFQIEMNLLNSVEWPKMCVEWQNLKWQMKHVFIEQCWTLFSRECSYICSTFHNFPLTNDFGCEDWDKMSDFNRNSMFLDESSDRCCVQWEKDFNNYEPRNRV